MAKKTEPKEERYYNFANMTDEEVDAVIVPIIEDCKAHKQKNGKITWTEPLLALRNSVIFDLMYKRGYSKRKTIDTLRARWQIGEQKCYDYKRSNRCIDGNLYRRFGNRKEETIGKTPRDI